MVLRTYLIMDPRTTLLQYECIYKAPKHLFLAMLVKPALKELPVYRVAHELIRRFPLWTFCDSYFCNVENSYI